MTDFEFTKKPSCNKINIYIVKTNIVRFLELLVTMKIE